MTDTEYIERLEKQVDAMHHSLEIEREISKRYTLTVAVLSTVIGIAMGLSIKGF